MSITTERMRGNLDTLLQRSDIAAVIIALPLTIQPDIVIKCLDAGKHVLSEKPVAATVLKGLSLIKDASKYVEKGLVWRVAENYEAEPVYRKAGKILNSGTIGSYPGGFLLDGGVHTTAALRTLLPRPLSQLSGFASLNKDYLAPHDTIHTIVRAGSHFHGTVDMTWAWPTKSKPIQEEMVITGTKGWLGIGRIEGGWRITVKILLNEKPESYEEKEENLEFTSQGVAQEFLQFFNVIRGERGLDIGKPLDALRDVAFIQAALTSDGNPVSLEDLVQE
ncbi:hypothetical protein VNI00_015031 [Paramarasmius palmivorus]|uniref:Gfo/Idh/MocA-like oxidoreductase N-terminal domain-containing protein n=1 Tax=Paramarasmius palmivorus TaxID=297713 RepID=A0AAW0BNB7_9AGAR